MCLPQHPKFTTPETSIKQLLLYRSVGGVRRGQRAEGEQLTGVRLLNNGESVGRTTSHCNTLPCLSCGVFSCIDDTTYFTVS